VTHSGPEVLFKTCVAMKFVDDDDDDIMAFYIAISYDIYLPATQTVCTLV